MSKRRNKRKKRTVGGEDGYTPLPFNRFHSDKVKENKKESRRRARKEKHDKDYW